VAIKGKKKSQQRGSQARRRPAMAPRPAPGRAQKVPWYKTTKGQTIAAISALILVVVGLAMFSNAKKEADERKQAQEALENYTDQVKALQQRISQPATEMATAAAAGEAPEDLAADAEEWTTIFTGAQAETAQFFAPEGATASGQLFTQSINLFKAAAETLTVAAGLEGQDQTALISAVSTQVQTAGGVWDAGVTVLDDARDEVELGASGVTSPISNTQPAIQATPGATTTVPVSPGGGGGGGGGKSGGGKNKKGDDS
jgi:hypothetical protein